MPNATFDGFDTYATIADLLAARHHNLAWTSATNAFLVPGRNGIGQAVQLSASVGRSGSLVGVQTQDIKTAFLGIATDMDTTNAAGGLSVAFLGDAGSVPAKVVFNATTGLIELLKDGARVAFSEAAAYSPFVYNYIELGGVVGGFWYVRVNQVEVLSAAIPSSVTSFAGLRVDSAGGGTPFPDAYIDDFYLNFDPLSPQSTAVDTLFLLPFTADTAPTPVPSVACVPLETNFAARFTGVVYADSGGVPGALLAAGAEVTGAEFGWRLTSEIATPPIIPANAPYWIGFIVDSIVKLQLASDVTTVGVVATNAYASGPPATAPAMTTGQPTYNMGGLPLNRFLGDRRVDAAGPIF